MESLVLDALEPISDDDLFVSSRNEEEATLMPSIDTEDEALAAAVYICRCSHVFSWSF